MNLKKFLNKNTNCFLKQSPAESILPRPQFKKQNRKKRFIADRYQNRVDGRHSQLRLNMFRYSRFNKVKEAETQIVREFLKMTRLEKARRDEIVNAAKLRPVDVPFVEKNRICQAEFDSQEVTIKPGSAGQGSTGYTSTLACAEGSTLHNFQHSYKAGFFFTYRSNNKISNRFSYSTPKLQTPDTLFSASKAPILEKNVSLVFSIQQIRNLLAAKRVERQTRSELRNQLLESRKIRLLYGGLSNQQLRRIIQKGRQLPGNASDNLLILLESRLDVVLQRCGFFPSIRTARQSVVHKQVYVNFKIINLPGYQLQPGDVLQLKPSRKKQYKSDSLLRLNTNNFLYSGQYKWEFSVSPFILYSLLQFESFLSAIIVASSFKCISNQHTIQSKNKSEFCFQTRSNNGLSQNRGKMLSIEGIKFSPAREERLCSSPQGEEMKSFCRFVKALTSPVKEGKIFNQSRYESSSLEDIPFLINQMIKESELDSLTRKKVSPFFDLFSRDMIFSTDKKNIEKGRKSIVRFAERKNQIKSFPPLQEKTSFPRFARGLASPIKEEIFFPRKGTKFSPIREEKGETLSLHSRETGSSGPINKDVIQSKNPVRYHYSGKGVILSILNRLCTQKQNIDVDSCLLKSEILQKESNRLNHIRQKGNDGALSHKDLPSFTSNLDWQIFLPCTFQADSLESLYNTYSYWLEIKKKLTSLPQSRNGAHAKDFNTPLKDQICFQEKRIKPLHLEISYKSCSAIFLYAPQRVYLTALIDLDLLVKAL